VNSYINHFRPIYEVRAAAFWLAALVLLPVSGMPYGWAFALVDDPELCRWMSPRSQARVDKSTKTSTEPKIE
jgi:hypothetical protein